MDLQDPDSEWSFHRMHCTDNMAIFWQKGFGPSLATAPDLEGNSMKVDLDNLAQKLESFYCFFRDTLHFVLPNSAAERTRMMVMLTQLPSSLRKRMDALRLLLAPVLLDREARRQDRSKHLAEQSLSLRCHPDLFAALQR